MKRYWDLIESPFATTFAAWVDEAGRLRRFNLKPTAAARLYSGAERNSKALSDVRRQVNEYAKGKRQVFDLDLEAEARVAGVTRYSFRHHHPLRRDRQGHRPS
jgi:hypothetical protein